MSVTLAAPAADLWMCIADPHRLGHERTYYPGCVNFRAADVIIINKANTAKPVIPSLLGRMSLSVRPACSLAKRSTVKEGRPSHAGKGPD